MTFQRFLILLSATSAGVIVVNLILQYAFLSLKNNANIAWWSLTLFIAISWLMYVLGKRAAKSPDKYFFNNVIIGSMLFKMIFSVAVLLIYKKTFHPEGKTFLIPFFIAYFVFTIFETYFMTQLTERKKIKKL